MIALYLVGPLDDALALPFPKGTRLLSLEESDGNLVLTLSDNSKTLSDSAFSLACTCLALTCISITDVEEVTVVSGERTMAISQDNLVLSDDITGLPETTEETT